LIEWPEGESEPTRYWLSTLPRRTSVKRLVYFAKLRFRIEFDYEELKQEIGLGHYEGRKWRGFHHHATMCIAAYAFLVAERGLFPPGGTGGQSRFPRFEISRGLRGRRSAGTSGATQPDLNRDVAKRTHSSSCTPLTALSELPAEKRLEARSA
jgi:hypothetical protein